MHLAELAQLSLCCAPSRARQQVQTDLRSSVGAINPRRNSLCPWLGIAQTQPGSRTAAELSPVLYRAQHAGSKQCCSVQAESVSPVQHQPHWCRVRPPCDHCAGLLSTPGNRNTAQIHANKHRLCWARLNAPVLLGKKAARPRPGSHSVLHVPDSHWLLMN